MKVALQIHGCGSALVAVLLLTGVAVYAQASPDEPAAILVYPYVVVDAARAFPVGDTVVAARVRDRAGNLGPPQRIVVRVME